MEADIFQDIFNALQHNKHRISLSLNNGCPIQKIVWSSFDYMRGPELEFVWEADYLVHNSNAPDVIASADVEKQQEFDNETTDGCTNSSDSSFSKNTGESTTTAQYEEIETYNTEHLQLSTEYYGDDDNKWNNESEKWQGTRGCSSVSGLVCDTSSSLTEETSTSRQTDHDSSTLTGQQRDSRDENEKEIEISTLAEHLPPDPNASEMMVTSCVDSGIGGTISIESNLSAYAKPPEPRSEAIYNSEQQSCSIKLERRDVVVGHIPEAQEVIEFKKEKSYAESSTSQNFCDPNPSGSANQMNSSMFSSFSYPNSPQQKNPADQNQPDRDIAAFYREAELFTTELASSDPLGNGLTDEAFVAKHVLAEQIGSIQLSTNPVLHKFCIIPTRHITFGSFIFSTRHLDQSRTTTNTLCAFTIVLNLDKSSWYLDRQPVFLEIFSNIIARFKAAALVETVEDLVCRCTRDFLNVFLLFGALERWPLAPRELVQLKIQSTHLWELKKAPNIEFVARCITACLMCRGRCTILGSNPREVGKLMLTLAAFLEPEDRLFCLRPFKMEFSPYLRLQAIKRAELHQFLERASTAHWSSALIDIDRCSVSYTGLYHNKHRVQKLRSQQCQIGKIFREALQSGLKIPFRMLATLEHQAINGQRECILETEGVQAEPTVREFLAQLCLMPLNRSARISFVDHFHLRLENRAKALIAFVRDISVPSPNDKRSALSSNWHLAAVRRNLNMLADSNFQISLAKAETLQPQIAEFVAQHTTNAGRFIHQ